MPSGLQTVEETRDALAGVGYLADESAALVSFLAARLGKPVLVEGPAGVGKTELAKALARATDRTLVRLQCYEGLDEAKALYEWNYRKQLLRIQAEADGAGWDRVQQDIFGEEFLLSRPLLRAITDEHPVVLLIDEIDKTDQEFEAMLLEVLSDFQISIPELGVIEARSRPLVLLTSNNSRELTEALKRRCLYLWLDYPSADRELEIVRLHEPDLAETVARRLVEIVHMVRQLDLKKPPSIAESIDWARALLLLGADDIDAEVFRRTLSVVVKHRTDLDLAAERIGVKLSDGLVAGPAPAGAGSTAGCPRPELPASPRASSTSRRSSAPRGSPWGAPSCSTHSGRWKRSRGRAERTSGRRWRPPSRSRRRTGARSTRCSNASSSALPSDRPLSAVSPSAGTREASGWTPRSFEGASATRFATARTARCATRRDSPSPPSGGRGRAPE